MPDQNEDPKSQLWPFWWWPRWMTDALSSSGSALAPQLLNQPILPGSTFGNVITVTDRNSSSPDMERDIVAKESYGRQLGRVIDALEVLIQKRPKKAPKSATLDDLLESQPEAQRDQVTVLSISRQAD